MANENGEGGVGNVKGQKFCKVCFTDHVSKETLCRNGCGDDTLVDHVQDEEQPPINAVKELCTENPPPMYGNFGCNIHPNSGKGL